MRGSAFGLLHPRIRHLLPDHETCPSAAPRRLPQFLPEKTAEKSSEHKMPTIAARINPEPAWHSSESSEPRQSLIGSDSRGNALLGNRRHHSFLGEFSQSESETRPMCKHKFTPESKRGYSKQSATESAMPAKRVLTDGETAILTIIQQGYGTHNSIDKVYFSPAGEAVMFVRLTNGMSIVMANLSDLAARRADGTISTDEELRTKWLRLKS
jgi:hypothetical protein